MTLRRKIRSRGRGGDPRGGGGESKDSGGRYAEVPDPQCSLDSQKVQESVVQDRQQGEQRFDAPDQGQKIQAQRNGPQETHHNGSPGQDDGATSFPDPAPIMCRGKLKPEGMPKCSIVYLSTKLVN